MGKPSVLLHGDAQNNVSFYVTVWMMNSVNDNSVKCVSPYYLQCPTQNIMVAVAGCMADDDQKTVVTSNSSATRQCLSKQAHAIMIKPTHIVANTGATSVFVLEGTSCKRMRFAEKPITILIPDGKRLLQCTYATSQYPACHLC